MIIESQILFKQKVRLRFVLSWILGMFASLVMGQTVSTTPQNKNYLIEKGTGHVCGSCPYKSLQCDSVVDSHPGRGFLILYHFGPDAVPQFGFNLQDDFTTPFGDTIFDPAKLGWPFYLNMMVNRRDRGLPYGSTFIFGAVNEVQPESDIVITQPSPVNLAMSSSFNPTTRLLTVIVEAYYTASSATPLNFIQIALTEDSIIGTQYDPSYIPNNNFNQSYVHNNTFRSNLTEYPGDTVTTTTAGTFITRTYSYTIPASYKNIPCNPNHCNLTFYMQEDKASSGVQSFTGKIQTVIRTKVVATPLSLTSNVKQNDAFLYPNPSNGIIHIEGMEMYDYSIDVIDFMGRCVYATTNSKMPNTEIDLSNYPKGVYLINITNSKGMSSHKIVLNN